MAESAKTLAEPDGHAVHPEDGGPTEAERLGPMPRLGEIGLENFAPYLMNRIMGRYNASLRDQMAEEGLTTAQMRSLAVLSVVDGIPIRDLAVYAVVEQSTLSRALDKLVRDGMVRRETDPNDSRATRLHLTDAGRDIYDNEMWPPVAESYAKMFDGIGGDEQRAFVATLQRILRNVRVHDF